MEERKFTLRISKEESNLTATIWYQTFGYQ